jgi:DNA-binding transcriptional MerR regulator
MFYDRNVEIKEAANMKDSYPIGPFAKKTGVTIRTLHYYDEIGILKPNITPSGRRFYRDHHFISLQKIVTLKFLGFSLDKIKELMETEHWNLKESLSFQKGAMQQKRAHLDRMIKTLDHALNLVEDDRPIDSSVFISIINGIQLEEEHKEWLMEVLPKEKVETAFNIPQEQQLLLEKQWLDLLSNLKGLSGCNPEGEEAQALIKEFFTIFTEVLNVDISFVLTMLNAEVPEDQTHTPMPFSKEEEEWLAKVMRYFLKQKGIDIEGDVGS